MALLSHIPYPEHSPVEVLTVPTKLIVRPAQADDYEPWLALWHGYCAALGGDISDAITEGVWHRILKPGQPMGCLLACPTEGSPVGLANYVLHLHTWGLRTICYLEDLFAQSDARGSGVGRALVEGLVALGKEQGWRRVYWHTHEDNYAARTLYDRLTPRTNYVRYDIDL
jgi:GNAT superfamily N-acetyltransferase